MDVGGPGSPRRAGRRRRPPPPRRPAVARQFRPLGNLDATAATSSRHAAGRPRRLRDRAHLASRNHQSTAGVAGDMTPARHARKRPARSSGRRRSPQAMPAIAGRAAHCCGDLAGSGGARNGRTAASIDASVGQVRTVAAVETDASPISWSVPQRVRLRRRRWAGEECGGGTKAPPPGMCANGSRRPWLAAAPAARRALPVQQGRPLPTTATRPGAGSVGTVRPATASSANCPATPTYPTPTTFAAATAAVPAFQAELDSANRANWKTAAWRRSTSRGVALVLDRSLAEQQYNARALTLSYRPPRGLVAEPAGWLPRELSPPTPTRTVAGGRHRPINRPDHDTARPHRPGTLPPASFLRHHAPGWPPAPPWPRTRLACAGIGRRLP